MNNGEDERGAWIEMKAYLIQDPLGLGDKRKLYKIETEDGRKFEIIAASQNLAIKELNDILYKQWKRENRQRISHSIRKITMGRL